MGFSQFDLAKPTGKDSDGPLPLRVRRRLSKSLSPLAPDPDVRRSTASDSCASAYYTPSLGTVAFPRGPPEEEAADAVADVRTLHTSISSTVVNSKRGSDGTVAKDLEAAIDSVEVASEVPFPLRRWYAAVMVLIFGGVAVALEIALILNQTQKGYPVPLWMTNSPELGTLVTNNLPYWIAILMAFAWGLIEEEIRRLQPLVNLANHDGRGANAQSTVLLDYVRSRWLVLRRNRCLDDWMVALGVLAWFLTIGLQSASNSVVTTRDVWWITHTNTTTLTRLSDDPGNQFLDMIAFQGASGYAAAKVLFNVGPAPFVTDQGHTVEMFELPSGSNGTLFANVSGVFNQAKCEISDYFDPVTDTGSGVFNSTAWFDSCPFSLTVQADSPSSFGVGIEDSARCNPSAMPIQYRPVVFWYFALTPQPMFSAVKCTPKLHAGLLSVTVDLAANKTSFVSSTDTANVSFGDVLHLAYNGLFFDDGMLDQGAAARLQGIRQQLPGAVFQVAKAKDPQLSTPNDFANITADVYNVYLSLIAKSLYFVDGGETIPADLGATCPRLFLVRWPVHISAFTATALAILVIAVTVGHGRARRRFGLTIPPHGTGTLATAAWLCADGEVRLALEHAYLQRDLAGGLDCCRFQLDRDTGRVVVSMSKARTGSESAPSPVLSSSPSPSPSPSLPSPSLPSPSLSSPAPSGDRGVSRWASTGARWIVHALKLKKKAAAHEPLSPGAAAAP